MPGFSLCWVEEEVAAAAAAAAAVVVRRGFGNNIKLCLYMSLPLQQVGVAKFE